MPDADETKPAGGDGFRRRLVKGSFWTVGASISRAVVSLGFNILLARLLTPEDFGVVAMALVVTDFVTYLGSSGIQAAVVQRTEVDSRVTSTAFYVSLASGVLIGGLALLSAPAAAAFYSESRLYSLLPILALQFPLSAAATVPMAMMLRGQRYVTISKISLAATILSGVISVAAAIMGVGLWAIVIRILAERLFLTLPPWWLSRWRPRLQFEWATARQLFKFSFPLFGQRLVAFIGRNVDKVLIGRFLGATSLGLYGRAYSLLALTAASFTKPVAQILFASFASIKDDQPRIRSTYLRFTGAIAVIVFPIAAGLGAVAQPFVIAFLGEQWEGAVPILQILSIVAVVNAPTRLCSSLFLATGRTDLQLRYTIIGRTIITLAIVAGFPFGVLGMAWGLTIGGSIDALLNLHFAARLVGLRWRPMLTTIAGPFGAAALMVAGVSGVLAIPAVASWNPWLQLAALVPLGGVIYLGVLHSSRPHAYVDTLSVMRSYVDRLRNREKKG